MTDYIAAANVDAARAILDRPSDKGKTSLANLAAIAERQVTRRVTPAGRLS